MLLKVNGVVRLTRDVELRYLPSGGAVCKFGMACSKKYKTASGEQKEDTLFIDGKIFGRMAEVANQYLKKGSKIFIDGELKLETWEKDGVKHQRHDVSINSFEMLDTKEQQLNNSGEKNEPKQDYRGNGYQEQGYQAKDVETYKNGIRQPSQAQIEIDDSEILF